MNSNIYGCSLANQNDTCNIYCEIPYLNLQSFSCGNAGTCNLYCNARLCYQSGSLSAINNLNVYGNAENCVKSATFTSKNGNASFYAMSNEALKEITIASSENTQKITIDCRGGYTKSCYDMTG